MQRAAATDSAPHHARHGARAWVGPGMVAGCVLCVGLALTWQLWSDARRDAQVEVQARFDNRAREVVNQLTLRMGTNVQILRAVQGLFSSSQNVTQAEFSAFVRAQKRDTPLHGMQGIGYIEAIEAAQLPAHVARMRRSGVPGYTITPSGERPLYAPIVYLESFAGARLRSLGHDALSEAGMAAMLVQARDSGQPAMSPRLEAGAAVALPRTAQVMIALPLYRAGLAPASSAERKAALSGWVYAPFGITGLMAGMNAEDASSITVGVFDSTTPSVAGQFYGPPDLIMPVPGQLRSVQAISIAGRRWTLVMAAMPGVPGSLDEQRPFAIVGTGLTATMLLTLLTWLLARSSAVAREALRKSRGLTRALEQGAARLASLAESAQRAQAMLRNILDSTIDGVLVDDGAQRVLASNQRLRTLWSMPPGLEVGGDGQAVVDHLLSQLVHPAPFLYSRSLHFQDGEERRDLLRLKDGRFFEQVTRAVRLGDEQARLWSFRDITERKQIEQRERSHRHVLELLARGAPLQGVLDAVVLEVEATNPGMLCTILLLDADGRHLDVGAAPSLPAFFNSALGGLGVGSGHGSCGRAVASGARVIADDIQTHPDWLRLRDVAARAQLASCWSEPIRGASGRVLGTFGIYHRSPGYPSPANTVLIEQAAQLAGIALEQHQAAQALRIGEERFRSLYDNAPVALWEQDWSAVRASVARLQDGGPDSPADLGAWLRARPTEARRLAALVRITDVNGAALWQVGARDKDLAALTLVQNFGAPEEPAFIDALVALAGGALFYECETSFLRLDGVARQHELTLLVMPGHERALDFVIVSTIDITERKQMDAELLVLATTDFLTGLPNRRVFMTRLDDQMARLQRSVDECAAVLMLDIDHFKRVNDVYGHATGDAVLRHMAGLMREGQRKIDTLGRMGGEEFAVLLPGANAEAAAAYAERLREVVAATPFVSGSTSIAITVSIGIATIRSSDASPDAALIRADKALYLAKANGRNRVCELAEVA